MIKITCSLDLVAQLAEIANSIAGQKLQGCVSDYVCLSICVKIHILNVYAVAEHLETYPLRFRIPEETRLDCNNCYVFPG